MSLDRPMVGVPLVLTAVVRRLRVLDRRFPSYRHGVSKRSSECQQFEAMACAAVPELAAAGLLLPHEDEAAADALERFVTMTTGSAMPPGSFGFAAMAIVLAALRPAPAPLTDNQKRILDALDGKALGVDDLAAACDIERPQLYPWGLKSVLEARGLATMTPGLGWWRPDRPPCCNESVTKERHRGILPKNAATKS